MRHVRGEYQPARLLKLYKPDIRQDCIVALQVPPLVSELDPAFTFLLDVGHHVYLWHGNLTPTEEDLVCTRYAENIRRTRGLECVVEALDDDTEIDAVRLFTNLNDVIVSVRLQHEFYTYLSRDTYRAGAKNVDDEHETSTLHRQQTTLRRHKANDDPSQLFKSAYT